MLCYSHFEHIAVNTNTNLKKKTLNLIFGRLYKNNIFICFRQSRALCRTDSGPRFGFDYTSHKFRKVLRHLQTSKGGIYLYKNESIIYLSYGLVCSSRFYKVSCQIPFFEIKQSMYACIHKIESLFFVLIVAFCLSNAN